MLVHIAFGAHHHQRWGGGLEYLLPRAQVSVSIPGDVMKNEAKRSQAVVCTGTQCYSSEQYLARHALHWFIDHQSACDAKDMSSRASCQ